MKQLITSSACTLVILALMIQMVYFQTAGAKLTAARSICASYAGKLRDGGQSEDIYSMIKCDIAKLTSCSESEICVTSEESPGGLSLIVTVPSEFLMKTVGFWKQNDGAKRIAITCICSFG